MNIDLLDDDSLLLIFKLFDPKTLFRTQRVSKRWYDLCQVAWQSKNNLNLRRLRYYIHTEPKKRSKVVSSNQASAVNAQSTNDDNEPSLVQSRQNSCFQSVNEQEDENYTEIEFMEYASNNYEQLSEAVDVEVVRIVHEVIKSVMSRCSHLKVFHATLSSDFRFKFVNLMNLSKFCPYLTELKIRAVRLPSDSFTALQQFPSLKYVMLFPYVDSLSIKFVPHSPEIFESIKNAFKVWKKLETLKIILHPKLSPLIEFLPTSIVCLHMLVKGSGIPHGISKELEIFLQTPNNIIHFGSNVPFSLEFFKKWCPYVESLTISIDCSKIYDFSSFKQLKLICLNGHCSVWSHCMNLLQSISSAKQVEKLDARISFPQTFSGLFSLAIPTNLTNVTYLLVDDCNMNVDFMECFLGLSPLLSKLKIRFCSPPTERIRLSLEAVAKRCKMLKCVILKGDWIPNDPKDDIELIHLIISNLWLYNEPRRPCDKPLTIKVFWNEVSEELLLNLENFYNLPVKILNSAKYW